MSFGWNKKLKSFLWLKQYFLYEEKLTQANKKWMPYTFALFFYSLKPNNHFSVYSGVPTFYNCA